MGTVNVNQIVRTPLARIAVAGGDVLHAMKATDPGYGGFGEAYFSTVAPAAVKAWKRHQRMTLNLVVPVGKVRFVFVDADGQHREEILGPEHYARLTVPPGLWFGFSGMAAPCSLILNVADIPHTPDEVDRLPPDAFAIDWEYKE